MWAILIGLRLCGRVYEKNISFMFLLHINLEKCSEEKAIYKIERTIRRMAGNLRFGNHAVLNASNLGKF